MSKGKVSSDVRDLAGRFATGNCGGPGRPRRPVEQQFLAVVTEECNLSDWREIVQKAVSMAKAGDHKSRDWLARHLIGREPQPLSELLAGELAVGLHFKLIDRVKALLRERDSSVSEFLSNVSDAEVVEIIEAGNTN